MSWPTFNLPAVSTCPNRTALCEATCYALKAERQYPDVQPCRARNFSASRAGDFVADMVADITRKAPKIFRIHESGDFYDISYFRKWVAIAEQCPGTQFFAFTKVYGLFSENRPGNLVLIASIFPDSDTSELPEGVATFTAVKRKAVGIGTHCAGSCDSCGICPFATSETQVWTEIH